MSWRETLLKSFGPGLLGGVTAGTWLRALRENHFSVSPSCWPRAGVISLQSLPTSVFHWADELRFGQRLKNVIVPPPVFLLGHWRQGTTHLHNLMTIDQRFAFPNNYQCLYPGSFLTAEKLHSKSIGLFLPDRRPMDNVEWKMDSPQEDEFALCISSLKSPCMGWVFPRRRNYYSRYLTMQDVSENEISEWKDTFVRFLKKLTLLYDRPLVLKSPPHTARIKLLLQMFPDARFVHIHRNPYDVFHSTRKMLRAVAELHRLQSVDDTDLDDWILQMYSRMYDTFFAERDLIPSGQFHELGFEQLELNPLGEIRRIYETLQLPGFVQVESSLRAYVGSIADYKKNRFPDFTPELRQRIAEQWQRSFEEWGYSCR